MSQKLHLIVLGKLKDKNLENIELDYLKRINSPTLEIHELKAQAQNKEKEGLRVIEFINSKCQNPYVVLLAEQAKTFGSIDFSSWLFEKIRTNKELFFVIGGAEGHSDQIHQFCHEKLSLSPLTFPHKIARILLVEQIYRAISIKNGHPYHN